MRLNASFTVTPPLQPEPLTVTLSANASHSWRDQHKLQAWLAAMAAQIERKFKDGEFPNP